MDMIPLTGLLCGFVLGFLICFTGVGGGVLVIPTIIFFFGLDTSVAIGTASIYVTLTKIMATIEHLRIGNVNMRLFTRLILTAVPGVIFAAVLVNYLLTDASLAEMVQDTLRVIVIVVILLSLLLMLYKPKKTAVAKPSPFALPACGGGIGLVMGSTGIGGGVLIAPALSLVGNETPKKVVGTSIITALVLSALTALIYTGGGQTDHVLALWMAAGSIIAIPLGSRFLRKVSQAFIHRSLIILILLSVVLMIFK